MRKICTFTMSVLFAVFVLAHARAEEMRIAVVDLKADGVPERTARSVSNMIRTELVNMRKFVVVERTQMNEIMKEQGFQQTGCTDQDCAVQLGRLMSARKILVGEVSPMGKAILMTVRIVDVEKGVSEFAASEKAESEDVLDRSVVRITQKLVSRIDKTLKKEKKKIKPEEPFVPTASGYWLRSIVPGWGQFYAGRTAEGVIFSSAAVLAVGFSTYAILDYYAKKKEYDDLGAEEYSGDPAAFDEKYDRYKSASTMVYISFAVAGGVYLLHWLDAIFLARPVFGKPLAASDAKSEGLFMGLAPWCGSGYLPEVGAQFTVGYRF